MSSTVKVVGGALPAAKRVSDEELASRLVKAASWSSFNILWTIASLFLLISVLAISIGSQSFDDGVAQSDKSYFWGAVGLFAISGVVFILGSIYLAHFVWHLLVKGDPDPSIQHMFDAKAAYPVWVGISLLFLTGVGLAAGTASRGGYNHTELAALATAAIFLGIAFAFAVVILLFGLARYCSKHPGRHTLMSR